MAVPQLSRASDGYVYSDRCREWSRWNDDYTKAANRLLGGQVHIETIPGRAVEGAAKFRFDPDRPSSDLTRMDALIEDAYNDVAMLFTDFRGQTWNVEVLQVPVKEPVTQGGYTKEVNDVTITLLRGASI